MQNRPHITNTFEDGIRASLDATRTPNTSAKMIRNFRLLKESDTNYVLTTIKGTEARAILPTGFFCVGLAEYNGIAYLLLHNPTTGFGQIGSFPSPGLNGQLAWQYRPFQNYNNGDFISSLFNFSLDRETDVEIQPDYDGSVNVIFTDGVNFRMVNSGFAILPGNRYLLPQREGQNNTNRYTVESFFSTLNVIQRSRKIVDLEFNGVLPGGRVKGGNYTYYFRYATQDGNETDVIEESSLVSVFMGNRVANVRGGSGDGEDTDKMVKFTLRNLDTAYRYLRVYFVQHAGKNQAVSSAFRIDSNYTIRGNEIEFTHTGYEDITRIDINTLSVNYSNIGSVGTIAQAQGYLVAGRIKDKLYNRDALALFASQVRISSKEVKLDIIGPENNMSRAFGETINQEAKVAETEGWNGAYANPKNIYHCLGYPGGEAFPFEIVYIFTDGSLSPGFPLVGCDNITGQHLTDQSALPTLNQYINGLTGNFDNQGNGKMQNLRGVYRFPARNSVTAAPMMAAGKITVNGVTFQMPDLNTDLGNGVKIKDITQGCFFVRAERKKDALMQGYVLPTFSVPTEAFGNYDPAGNRDQERENNSVWGWFKKNTDSDVRVNQYTPEYLSGSGKRKVLPLVRSEVEGTNWFTADNTDNRWNVYTARLQAYLSDPKRYGFYSADTVVDAAGIAGNINGRSLTLAYLGNVLKQSIFTYQNTTFNNIFSNGTVYQPNQINPNASLGNIVANSHFVLDGSVSGDNYNELFGAKIDKTRLHIAGEEWLNVEHLLWNSYIGLFIGANTVSNGPLLGQMSEEGHRGSLGGDAQLLQAQQLAVSQMAYLANLYPGLAGPRTSRATMEVYQNVDSFQYFPISQRMSWETLESSLDSQRRLTCFRGDTYIGLNYQRLFWGEKSDTDASYVGKGIGLVHESIYNVVLRNEETFSIGESEKRSFFPYYKNEETDRHNFWRRHKQPETTGYNQGYAITKGSKQYLSFPQNVPYLAVEYMTGVAVSGFHTPNAFENGYRHFEGLNRQDYPAQYGALRKLINVGGLLYALFDHAVAPVPLNERVVSAKDSAGAIFYESAGILPPQLGYATTAFGCQNQSAVKATDNGVYFTDLSQMALVSIKPGEGAKILSELTIDSELQKYLPYYQQAILSKNGNFLTVHHHQALREVWFTFHKPQQLSLEVPESFTVVYNERLEQIAPILDATPAFSFSLQKRFFSLKTDRIYEHEVNPLHSLFYNVPVIPSLRYAVGSPDREVVFENLALQSNHILPEQINFYVPGGRSVLDVIYDPEDIGLSNAKYLRGEVWLPVPRLQEVTNQDTSEYLPAGEDNALSQTDIGGYLRGHAMEVLIRYQTSKQVKLKSTQTYIQLTTY